MVERMQPQDIKLAVYQTLEALGFDIKNIRDAQADMAYLRKIRQGSEMMTARMKISIAGVMLSTGMFLLWKGFAAFFKDSM